MSSTSFRLIHRTIFFALIARLAPTTAEKEINNEKLYLSFDTSPVESLKLSSTNCIVPYRVNNMVVKNRCNNGYGSLCKNSTRKCHWCLCKFRSLTNLEKINPEKILTQLFKVKVHVVEQEDFESRVKEKFSEECNLKATKVNATLFDEAPCRSKDLELCGYPIRTKNSFDFIEFSSEKLIKSKNHDTFKILFFTSIVVIIFLTTLLLLKSKICRSWKKINKKTDYDDENQYEGTGTDLDFGRHFRQLRHLHMMAESRTNQSQNVPVDQGRLGKISTTAHNG